MKVGMCSYLADLKDIAAAAGDDVLGKLKNEGWSTYNSRVEPIVSSLIISSSIDWAFFLDTNFCFLFLLTDAKIFDPGIANQRLVSALPNLLLIVCTSIPFASYSFALSHDRHLEYITAQFFIT
jgi:hypothetical protein